MGGDIVLTVFSADAHFRDDFVQIILSGLLFAQSSY